MTPKPRRIVERLIRTAVPQSGRYCALRLDKNERCAGYPASVVRGMLRTVSSDQLTAYPEPGPLYERLAKLHRVEIDNLAVTAGSELAIRYLFEAFLGPGDELVLLNPSFAMFEVYARLRGARLVPVNFDRSWQVEPDEILRCITARTKMVALANPNNPTGTVLDEKALLAIARRASRFGALLLVDEAYYHFYKQTMLDHFPRFENLVITRTFSKAFGAAGVRLGYAIGSQRVIAMLNKVQPIDHVNAFAVLIGCYLLDHEALMEDYVRQTIAGKRYLVAALSKLGIPAINTQANFVLADVGCNKSTIIGLLRDRNVHVGAVLRLPFPSNHIRVTAGPPLVMRRFISALKESLIALERGINGKAVSAFHLAQRFA